MTARRHFTPAFAVAALVVLAVAGPAGPAVAATDAPARDTTPQTIATLGLSDEDAVRKGEAVVEHWDKCDYDFIDMKSDFTLIQTDADGRAVQRTMRLLMLERMDRNEAGIKTTGDWSIVMFLDPPDVAGTKLLIHANLEENDDTWMYMPALQRVKRISSANQSGNFAGTEFAFEDMASQEFYKFTYKWLYSEPCGTEAEPGFCDVVEQYPTYPNSGYLRQVSWYDGCRQRRIDYYDHNDTLYKTQTFNDYRQYNGKNWRGHDNTMINHRTGRSTHLVIPEFRYRSGFTEQQFQSQALRFIE